MSQYAVVNSQGVATIVGRTMRGAKNYATRNNYKTVCQVSKYSMICYDFYEKRGKKWVEVK